MAMKLLRARETATAFVHVVHTDTSKVMEDGKPDGNFVRVFRHDSDFTGTGLTKAQYVARIRRQIKLELLGGNGLDEGAALAGEGSDF